ncbi:hypothetical protein BDN71DRAFT_1510850 [Pleurotus eryngii]|uniref:Uncharacterized protein n=1 Tax=Pleurotus eryngii TaxID=5323 RepID=A0A9P6DCN7_PLEER|nr:hypothetical protein BDN71DRAFT_1510850 [Pleurotus eryngii]
MSTAIEAPYGTWESPISAACVARLSNSIAELLVDPITNKLYHVELRPGDEGKNALVETERARDLVSGEWDVRTGVHDYGGGAAIIHGGIADFSNYSDGRVYSIDVKSEGATPEAVTPVNRSKCDLLVVFRFLLSLAQLLRLQY